MKKRTLIFSLFLVLTLSVSLAYGAEKCPLCGMDILGNENTEFVVEQKKGEVTSYCCPHCGLWVMSQEGDKVLYAKARDFISGEWVKAQDAFYVFNSKAVPACSPSWIAFEKKAEAEMFQKGFGGTVYSYKDALKKRASMPKDMDTK